MESYVISVSLGTGCYRHIQIGASATLFRLHQAILSAFEFEDDHEHAFFLDNHVWSPYDAYYSTQMEPGNRLTKKYTLKKLNLTKGQKFKYVFDFGDEWVFQCRVLRQLEENTDVPGVIRSVGEAPEQYPDWEEDEEADTLSKEEIEALYARVPLSREVIQNILRYMDAAANLYGLISLEKLLEIYNSQNPNVEASLFLLVATIANYGENDYTILERDDLPKETEAKLLAGSEITANYLLLEDPESDIRDLRRIQKGKSYKIFPKQEFLKFADSAYYPETPQRAAMIRYLRRRAAALSMPPEDFCDCLQLMAVIDASLQDVVNVVESEGLTFNQNWDIGEFAALYQDLNNTTHKHVNRGYTPDELFAQSDRGRKLAERNAPLGQLSLFDEMDRKPKPTLTGTPPRNAPCPCGSGRKYKNCCGKK